MLIQVGQGNDEGVSSGVEYTLTKSISYDITAIKYKVPSVKYVHDYIAHTVNNLENVDQQIIAALGNYSTTDHKHTLEDVIDYEPYNDTDVRNLINKRLVVNYEETFDTMKHIYSIDDLLKENTFISQIINQVDSDKIWYIGSTLDDMKTCISENILGFAICDTQDADIPKILSNNGAYAVLKSVNLIEQYFRNNIN